MRFAIVLFVLLSVQSHSLAQRPAQMQPQLPTLNTPHIADIMRYTSAQHLAFIENKGQWDSQARFMARLKGMNLWLTDGGFVYDFHRTNPDSTLSGHVVRMKFKGGNVYGGKHHIPAHGEDKHTEYYNYFLGNDSTKWASNVPLYGAVRLE